MDDARTQLDQGPFSTNGDARICLDVGYCGNCGGFCQGTDAYCGGCGARLSANDEICELTPTVPLTE